jgi:hypothetical protein
MNDKVIICRGSALIPARFWDRAVCSIEEYTKELKESGWVITQSRLYLNKDQLSYLIA